MKSLVLGVALAGAALAASPVADAAKAERDRDLAADHAAAVADADRLHAAPAAWAIAAVRSVAAAARLYRPSGSAAWCGAGSPADAQYPRTGSAADAITVTLFGNVADDDAVGQFLCLCGRTIAAAAFENIGEASAQRFERPGSGEPPDRQAAPQVHQLAQVVDSMTVIGVIVRFLIRRYRASPLYRGRSGA